MNINRYVPLLIDTLDTIMRGIIMLTMLSPLVVVTFFTLLMNIVFCQCYNDFHFISNRHFGYFSFSRLCLG